ncbi:MAG: hypothetical protein ACK5L7_09655 [Paludibacteraceae bacterium]
MKKNTRLFMLSFVLFFVGNTHAQVTIGGNTEPNSHAVLDLISNDAKGLLLPRVTTAQRTAIFPTADANSAGLQVYDTSTKSTWYYDGANWQQVSKSLWETSTANTGIWLAYKSDYTAHTSPNSMIIKDNGNIGVGTNDPAFTTSANTGASIPTFGVDGTVNATNYTSPIQTLTSGSIAWDLSKGANAKVTLTGNSNLILSNAKAGMYGLIIVTQDGTGSRTLTFATGSNKVICAGNGAVGLTGTAGSTDILSFFYDGTNYWWTVGLNYN